MRSTSTHRGCRRPCYGRWSFRSGTKPILLLHVLFGPLLISLNVERNRHPIPTYCKVLETCGIPARTRRLLQQKPLRVLSIVGFTFFLSSGLSTKRSGLNSRASGPKTDGSICPRACSIMSNSPFSTCVKQYPHKECEVTHTHTSRCSYCLQGNPAVFPEICTSTPVSGL